MYYIGNAVKSVVGIYNQINSATLTGAIDIVVIRQEDGSYIGSPFHVRFGKLGVVSSREKVVEISVNDVEVDLQMKLGQAGEAFFVEAAARKESVPYNLATSPIPSVSYLDKFHFQKNDLHENRKDSFDDDNVPVKRDLFIESLSDADVTEEANTHASSDAINIQRRTSQPYHSSHAIPIRKTKSSPFKAESHLLRVPEGRLSSVLHDLKEEYALSDMDSPISSPLAVSSDSSDDNEDRVERHICSDTEAERKPRSDSNDITWEWGMLPEGTSSNKTPRENKSSAEKKKKQGINKAKKNLQSKSEGLLLDEVLAADKEVADLYLHRAASMDDIDSGYGRESTPVKSPTVDQEDQDDANKDESLNLVDEDSDAFEVEISLCGDLKSRKVAPVTFMENLISFEKFTENPLILNDPKLVIKINDSYYNWAIAAPYIMAYTVYQKKLPKNCLKKLKQQYMPKKRRGWFYWRSTEQQESSEEESFVPNQHASDVAHLLSENEDYTSAQSDGEPIPHPEYKKSLRLTSEQWASLNLKHGANKVTFTVTTRYQGTASCDAHIYLWNHSDKIVISDIDGTITRSDVLGQMFPLVGKDWSQRGVTGLFSKIQQNGYHFMYLSARAIGQAQLTRDFLRSVKQGELTLPNGPVLLTPTSLLKAFKKEVIERKPEEFKISCMRDIQALFPKASNPFWSGFGNRINDVYAYRTVGIPISRIFTINYKGEIKHELTNAFTTSYNKLIELVDQMFPPLSSTRMIDSEQSDYTSFSYWRRPVVEIPALKDVVNVEEFEFP